MNTRELDERGMVTAETAVASLFVVGFTAMVAWLLGLLMMLASCQATADQVAREHARGDIAAAEVAASHAPEGAKVLVDSKAGDVVVLVTLDARPWVSWLPAVPLRASATVRAEE
ncbi:MAG: hypothetical protein LBR20_06865 [Propionibacteriaceae bacterium]|jgi:hypothetical protein|nr:hypothetical protein [Propionibacteriaceae bacterium]